MGCKVWEPRSWTSGYMTMPSADCDRRHCNRGAPRQGGLKVARLPWATAVRAVQISVDQHHYTLALGELQNGKVFILSFS